MIIITAKKDGFRRCGMAHSAKPVQHNDDAFSQAQLEQLQAEPMLVVELVADEPKELGQGVPLKEDVDVDPAVAEAEGQGPEEPLNETEEPKPASKKGSKKASEE